MSGHPEVAVVRWSGETPSELDALAGLLASYHLCTQDEKGEAVAAVDALPDRYRAEILDPRAAFAGDAVLLAVSDGTAVGCLVVTAAADGWSEVKRLWTGTEFRGRGVASHLIAAALTHAADSGADTVRLSVWAWRTTAVALYERFGFTVTESWDERAALVCMERTV